MSPELKQEIGLLGVFSISVGGMVGPALFVLPGVAISVSGPSVLLSYLASGLVAILTALSISELATAIPSPGGPYVFLERALGPAIGAIVGIGTWFSLIFKSAFSLVGVAEYLLAFVQIPIKPVALGIAVAVIIVNIAGVKLTEQIQKVIVSLVLLALLLFLATSLPVVNQGFFEPFVPFGSTSVLHAAGLVFVSYIGIIKAVSVAEEVENPDDNLPKGVLLSLGLMIGVYFFVVYAILGLLPFDELGHVFTAVAAAGEVVWGPLGFIGLSVVAVLALISMANAGVLSSARYPLAMSRDSVLPRVFERVHPTLLTPVNSVLLTGALLLTFVAFIPVVELAELASAFLILVFALVNIAVLALRESHREWYTPSFTSPGYPAVQIGGVVGSVFLLSQMGIVPILAVLAIVAGGGAWYWWYARSHRRDVTQLMNKEVATVTKDLDSLQAARKMEEEDKGYLVVMDDTTPIGIITEKDYVVKIVAVDSQPSDILVEEVMSSPLITIEPDVSVGDALRILREKKIRHLPVVSDGDLHGIVTSAEVDRFFELEIT